MAETQDTLVEVLRPLADASASLAGDIDRHHHAVMTYLD